MSIDASGDTRFNQQLVTQETAARRAELTRFRNLYEQAFNVYLSESAAVRMCIGEALPGMLDDVERRLARARRRISVPGPSKDVAL